MCVHEQKTFLKNWGFCAHGVSPSTPVSIHMTMIVGGVNLHCTFPTEALLCSDSPRLES